VQSCFVHILIRAVRVHISHFPQSRPQPVHLFDGPPLSLYPGFRAAPSCPCRTCRSLRSLSLGAHFRRAPEPEPGARPAFRGYVDSELEAGRPLGQKTRNRVSNIFTKFSSASRAWIAREPRRVSPIARPPRRDVGSSGVSGLDVDLIVGRAEVALDEEPLVLGIKDGALVLVAGGGLYGVRPATGSRAVRIAGSGERRSSRRSASASRS